MAEGGKLKVVLDSLHKARQYSEDKNYGRSFAHYLVVFQLLTPEARTEYENEFTNVLHIWGSILHNSGKYEDIFKCYHLATNYFPHSAEILNNLGIHALKLRNFKSAKMYFEQALNINPNFLPAEQNLQTSKYVLVERWHFPMLNDIIRNKSYAQAIFMEISHGFNNIVDVGTGTGILSLFASKSKQCKSILACDYSDTMYEISNEVFKANNIQNVKLVQQCSTQLSVPEDLKKRATLLVTEIIDSGIFGENILGTLIHAWENLLISYPYGKVIPAGVTISVVGVESVDLCKKIRLVPNEKNLLNMNKLCLMYSTIPYDTENLKRINVEYMTEINSDVYINFNNILQLKMLEQSEKNPNITLKCLKTGKLDGFAVWFKLHLNDSVSITNNPLSDLSSCWEQAVIHLRHPMQIQKDDQLPLNLSCSQGYLEVYCNRIPKTDDSSCFLVPRDTILFLNDCVLLNCLEESVNILLKRFNNMKDLLVLDMTPFPVLGLLLVKHGASLTYRLKNPNTELAIRKLCELNSIDSDKIQFVTERYFNEFTDDDVSFDVIIQNLITPCGLLFEEEIHQAPIMKILLTPRGIYLPSKMIVWGQLVQCDWLNKVTKVDDANVCGFKIANFINEYKSSEHRDMNFYRVPHITLSPPLNLGYVTDDYNTIHETSIRTTVLNAGCANAIFYWFEVKYLEDSNSVTTRSPGAFANNAAFMLKQQMDVHVDDILTINFKQHRGIMKIYIPEG